MSPNWLKSPATTTFACFSADKYPRLRRLRRLHTDFPAIDIKPRWSRCLLFLLLATHGAAVVAIPLTDTALGFRWMLAGGVLVSLMQNLRCHFFEIPGSSFTWRTDGSWTYADPRGTQRRISNWKAAWVSPRLILIRLQPDHGWRWVTLVLCSDSVTGELHRQLRVRLNLFNHRHGVYSCPESKL